MIRGCVGAIDGFLATIATTAPQLKLKVVTTRPGSFFPVTTYYLWNQCPGRL